MKILSQFRGLHFDRDHIIFIEPPGLRSFKVCFTGGHSHDFYFSGEGDAAKLAHAEFLKKFCHVHDPNAKDSLHGL